MKKVSQILLVMVSIIFILSACTGNEQERESKISKPATKTDDQVGQKMKLKEETSTNEITNDQETPIFHVEAPSIKKVSPDSLDIVFDNSYEEVCWNDCSAAGEYNYPDIHSGDVEDGDRIIIDWRTAEPAPSEVRFIQLNSAGEEVEEENIKIDNSTLDIKVDEEKIGKQYAVQFLWKDGEELEGQSVLNFKLE